MGAQKLIAKVIVFVLFGLLILSFAVWGIGDIFRGGGQVQSVAEVGEQQIEIREFNVAFAREVNQLSRQFGTQINGEQAVALGIDRRVLQGLISRTLFMQQAADLGMTVTTAQEKRRIVEEEAFQDDTGQFSRQRFTDILRNSGLSEEGYRADLRRDIMRGQLVDALIKGPTGSMSLAKALFTYQQEKRKARYIVVPHPALDAIAEPDDATLDAYYETNKGRFLAPETRAITLVSLEPEDYLAEVSVTDEEIEADFEARKESLTIPEKRDIDQLVFGDENDALAAVKRLEEGVSMADVAAENEKASHVNLGLVAKGDLLPSLGDAAFVLEQGAFSLAVKSPVGWHVLQVIAIFPGKEPVLAEVRDDLRREIALDKAVDSVIGYVNAFNDALGSGASLESAATELGLISRSIPSINRQGQDTAATPVEDLPPQPGFTQVLFDTPEGETSLMTETADGGYFILRVDQVSQPAPRPLAEVRDEAIALWRANERAQQARTKAQELLQRLGSGESLDTLAEAEGLALVESPGLLRQGNDRASLPAADLPAKLFDLAAGEAVTTSGDTGEILLTLGEIIPVELGKEAAGLDQMKDSLAQNLQNDILDQYLSALQKDFGVTVHENRVQEILSSY